MGGGRRKRRRDGSRKERREEGSRERGKKGMKQQNPRGYCCCYCFLVIQLSIDVGHGLHYKMPHFYRSMIKLFKEQFLLLSVYILILL